MLQGDLLGDLVKRGGVGKRDSAIVVDVETCAYFGAILLDKGGQGAFIVGDGSCCLEGELLFLFGEANVTVRAQGGNVSRGLVSTHPGSIWLNMTSGQHAGQTIRLLHATMNEAGTETNTIAVALSKPDDEAPSSIAEAMFGGGATGEGTRVQGSALCRARRYAQHLKGKRFDVGKLAL